MNSVSSCLCRNNLKTLECIKRPHLVLFHFFMSSSFCVFPTFCEWFINLIILLLPSFLPSFRRSLLPTFPPSFPSCPPAWSWERLPLGPFLHIRPSCMVLGPTPLGTLLYDPWVAWFKKILTKKSPVTASEQIVLLDCAVLKFLSHHVVPGECWRWNLVLALLLHQK